jgi:hypothetical protein
VPTFADRGCQVVSVTDSHGCILGFLDRQTQEHLPKLIFWVNILEFTTSIVLLPFMFFEQE